MSFLNRARGSIASSSDSADYWSLILDGPPQNGLITYDINVSATSGSTLDPKIELYDPKGNLVAEDDNHGLGATAARIKYTLEPWDGGRYHIAVKRAGTSTGEYTIDIETE